MRPKYQMYARSIIRDLILTVNTVKSIASKYDVPLSAISDITEYYFKLTPTQVRYQYWLTPIPGMVDIGDVEQQSQLFLSIGNDLCNGKVPSSNALDLRPGNSAHQYLNRRYGMPLVSLRERLEHTRELSYGKDYIVPHLNETSLFNNPCTLLELSQRFIKKPAPVQSDSKQITVHVVDVVVSHIKVTSHNPPVNLDLPTHLLCYNEVPTRFYLAPDIYLELMLQESLLATAYRIRATLFINKLGYLIEDVEPDSQLAEYLNSITVDLNLHIRCYGTVYETKSSTLVNDIRHMDGQATQEFIETNNDIIKLNLQPNYSCVILDD